MFAIVHSQYGPPESVLSLAERKRPEPLGDDEVLIRVTLRPVHPGDLHIVAARPQAGPPIPAQHNRVPGFEGTGRIVSLGSTVQDLREGQRVAFFPVEGAWAEYVIAKRSAVVALPDTVVDEVAAQMLINPITALLLLRVGQLTTGTHIVLNAAASSVGRLLTQVALDRGVRPLRLVRSQESAERLKGLQPGPPVYSTSDSDWKTQIRDDVHGQPIQVGYDAIGGSALTDLADILDEGGTLINFGYLGGYHSTHLSFLAPKNLSLKSASIMNWFGHSEAIKEKDFQVALELAKNHSELFLVAQSYPLDQYRHALDSVSAPGKSGVVLLKN